MIHKDEIARLHQLFTLDKETGVLMWRESRGPCRAGTIAGCRDAKGYVRVRIGGRVKTGAHRVVFAMLHGYMPAIVDHVNGCPWDNRPANLRAATNAENCRNSGARVTSRSGVKGVSWRADKSAWQAYGWLNGSQKHLGFFSDLEAAAAASKAFREKYHGEFANHCSRKVLTPLPLKYLGGAVPGGSR